MGLRREGRELALQALYSLDLNPMETRESLRLLRENARVPSAVRVFAEELVVGVMANVSSWTKGSKSNRKTGRYPEWADRYQYPPHRHLRTFPSSGHPQDRYHQ